MRLLLDTHVVLWWLTDDPTLADEIKDLIDDEPEVYVSPATVWELAIKQSLGKLPGPVDVAEQVRKPSSANCRSATPMPWQQQGSRRSTGIRSIACWSLRRSAKG